MAAAQNKPRHVATHDSWKAECVGDDIASMKFDDEGKEGITLLHKVQSIC